MKTVTSQYAFNNPDRCFAPGRVYIELESPFIVQVDAGEAHEMLNQAKATFPDSDGDALHWWEDMLAMHACGPACVRKRRVAKLISLED